MKRYEHITDILKTIMLNYQRGYTCWVSFDVRPEKLPDLATKFRDLYGTHFPPAERYRRKRKGLPTAIAFAGPDYGRPDLVRVFVMATEFAKTFPQGPFSREKWNVVPPEYSRFHMVQEPRERGDYAWTWRIQNRDYGILDQWLTQLVKTGKAEQVRAEAEKIVSLNPLFGGVRRQVRRLLRSSSKLWAAIHRTDGLPWPGPDPEKLPMMGSFKADKGVAVVQNQ
jgi:hypothetical protein